MSVYQLSDDELLTLGDNALKNSQLPPILDAMTPFGYTEASYERGRSLLGAYRMDVEARQVEFGEQLIATEPLGDAWEAVLVRTCRFEVPETGNYAGAAFVGFAHRLTDFDALTSEEMDMLVTVAAFGEHGNPEDDHPN